MQALKTMFRSPRFVVGFIMVMTILCYAIFVPVFIPGDPKANREESPYYDKVVDLRDAIVNQDDAAIQNEIDNLREMAAENTDPILADAVNNLNASVDAVEEELAKNPLDGAISSLEQVKSARKYPLINAERETMKALLEAGDVEGAKAEGDRLIAHCQEAETFAAALNEAVTGSDFAAAQGALDAFTTKTETEVVDIEAAIEAQDIDTLATAAETFATQHAKFYEYVQEALTRMDSSMYVSAVQVLMTSIQKTYLIPKNTAPNSTFWLGTDNFSRDLFLEMAYGARTSLLVGLIAGILATLIGITLGLTAGFVGGIVDNVITVLTNTFIVIPGIIILILISIAIGQFREMWMTGIVIGCIAWPWTARAVRAQTTSLRYRDHVNMAKITGYSTAHIIMTEIMPYIMSYIVMAFILQVAGGIMQEATLAILGLGDPTGISLGRLMNWAMEYEAINYNRWWLFIPVACSIAMITYGLYLMNSGMDQVFNPKIRS